MILKLFKVLIQDSLFIELKLKLIKESFIFIF